jgi:hypothetical protein
LAKRPAEEEVTAKPGKQLARPVSMVNEFALDVNEQRPIFQHVMIGTASVWKFAMDAQNALLFEMRRGGQ